MESYFKDLYSIVHGDKKHSPVSTFKYREESGTVCRTIDFIFCAQNDAKRPLISAHLDTSEILDKINSKKLTMNPSMDHPSDHFYLGYKLAL